MEAALVLRRASPRPVGPDTSRMRESAIFPYQITDKAGEAIGTLKIWYDAETRVAKRELTIVHPKLEAALASRRLPLEPRRLPTADSIDTLREVTLREVEEILRRKFGGAESGTRVEVAPAAVGEGAASQPRALPSAPRERPVPAKAVRAKAAHVQQVDEGYVQSWGWDKRSIPDNDSPTGGMKTIEHYYVDVELTNGENPGGIKRVWGADLERAIAAAAPRHGDRIRISHLGRQAMAGADGEKRRNYKNVYEIELMGAKR